MPAGSAVVGPLDRALAAELRAEIGRRGLQDKHVAVEAGIPTSTFSKLVRRPTTPMRVTQLAAICAVLDVEPAEIMRVAVAAHRAHANRSSAEDPDVAALRAAGLSDESIAEAMLGRAHAQRAGAGDVDGGGRDRAHRVKPA